ncbi:hypothetical protein PVAND_017372 [Polypedilum vanderplanki]|uniref:Uncharacterized protein n=1 Tax=Polypedilum vanderplanki TaxID=319348 RepID=A0A9J6BI32_POLVA|nr:hypothetical protein PVAND_017372 [Polypedilum vanderplanki]
MSNHLETNNINADDLENFEKALDDYKNNQLQKEDPKFINMVKFCLQSDENYELKCKTIGFILFFLSSYEINEARILVENKIVPILIELLYATDYVIVNNAIATIANIAMHFRDYLIECNLFDAVFHIFSSLETLEEVTVLAISHLMMFCVANEDPLSIQHAGQIASWFLRILNRKPDVEIDSLEFLAHTVCLDGLDYIAEWGHEYIDAMKEYNLIDTITPFLNSNQLQLQKPASRIHHKINSIEN